MCHKVLLYPSMYKLQNTKGRQEDKRCGHVYARV
jgi:hypothetical protein